MFKNQLKKVLTRSLNNKSSFSNFSVMGNVAQRFKSQRFEQRTININDPFTMEFDPEYRKQKREVAEIDVDDSPQDFGIQTKMNRGSYTGVLVEGFSSLKQMSEEADTTTEYNELMHRCLQYKDAEAIKVFFDDMKNNNISKTLETYAYAISSCLFDNNILRATEYFRSMIEDRVDPTPEFYSTLKELFESQNIKEAAEVLNDIQNKSLGNDVIIKEYLPKLTKIVDDTFFANKKAREELLERRIDLR